MSGGRDSSNPNILLRLENSNRCFFVIRRVDYFDESLRQFFSSQLVDRSVENNNAPKSGSGIRLSGSSADRGPLFSLAFDSNSWWIVMLHHRHRRLLEISDDSQPMTSILDIRR